MSGKNWLLLLGTGMIVAGYFLYDRFGTAHLVISSEPPGAMVRLDRRQIGLTPLTTSVDAGRHMLELQHSHYAVYSQPLDLSRGDRFATTVKLEPGPGTLTLLSNPIGAWVEVNGVRLEQITPTRFETASGEKVIRMGLPERHGVEETVTLRAGATLEVNLDLNIDPHGSLTVAVKPRDATVKLPLSEVPYKAGVRVPIGEHLLHVSRRGYVAQEFRQKVVYGTNLVRVELKRDYGKVTVRVDPPDAEITVSYREGNRWRPQTYTPGMGLPVGDVEVRARFMGYRTEFSEFNLTNAGHSVKLSLSRVDIEPGSSFSDKLNDGGSAPEMVVLPAGSFQMGNQSGPPSEQPVRTVTITQPFAMSVYEVNIEEYARFAAATGAKLSPRLIEADPREPIRYVGWEDAVAYTQWLTQQSGARYRLPTEAEWEYAARAGTQSDYFHGDEPLQLCTYANLADRSTRRRYREWKVVNCDDGHEKIAPVGSLAVNPFGLHDIYGNAAEWVAECGMPEYASAPTDGAEAQRTSSCESHGIRGGSWDSQPDELRSAYRNTAGGPNDDRGIRLLREL